MPQQAREIMAAERAQRLAAVLGHESVLAAGARDDRLMQVPARREQVRQLWAAHEGGVIAVAAGDLLHGAAEQHHVVGGLESRLRRKGEFALARAELDLDRAQGQAERQHVAPDDFQHRLHLVVALLGQILIAVRQQADIGRRARLSRMLRRHFGVFELEDVEFDFEARDEIVAALCQLIEHRSIKMSRRERHRPPIGKMQIAHQPSRARRPRQHAKRGGIGHHQHVGGAFHLLHPKAAAGGEHRKHRAVRGVLGEHRGGDRAAVLQRGQRLARHQRLAPEDAVLIGKRQPDHLQLLLLDDFAKAACRLLVALSTRARDARQNSTRHSLGAWQATRHNKTVVAGLTGDPVLRGFSIEHDVSGILGRPSAGR